MAYHKTWKRNKVWSEQANKVKERERLECEAGQLEPEIDPYLRISIERRGTGESVVFECFEGSRIDNYSVYCNDEHIGIMGITALTTRIRKALPAFRRMDEC